MQRLFPSKVPGVIRISGVAIAVLVPRRHAIANQVAVVAREDVQSVVVTIVAVQARVVQPHAKVTVATKVLTWGSAVSSDAVVDLAIAVAACDAVQAGQPLVKFCS